MKKRDKTALGTLMQNGYDFNFIASPHMKGNKKLEAHFRQMAARFYETLAQQYEDLSVADKQQAFQRFCMTMGIGAAWWWENRHDEVADMGLYEAMATARTEDEMDEYIEDTIGIWYSPESLQHRLYRNHFSACLRVIKQHYDLNNCDDELSAGIVMMTYGMYCGYTRHLRQCVLAPYKGEMPWHSDVWMSLYGEDEVASHEQYMQWAWKAVTDADSWTGNDVFTRDQDSEFGWHDRFYHSSVYHAPAGIKTISYNDNGICKMVAAPPVFQPRVMCALELEQVQVWDNGVEATLVAHFANDPDLQVTFYDTHYLEHKDLYVRGMEYVFDLYGAAYRAQVVPEDDRTIVLEGDKAVSFNEKLGRETTRDEKGNPEPVVFHTHQLHCLLQTDDKLPEDATFRAPIKDYFKTVDFFGKPVHAVEVGLPFRDKDGDKEHTFTLFVSPESSPDFATRPPVDTPINAVVRLQGRMVRAIVLDERPSTLLHSFDALDPAGRPAVFHHLCPDDECGQEMNDDEKRRFVYEILEKQFTNDPSFTVNWDASEPDAPDYRASRMRDIWVRADSDYNAASAFQTQDVTDGMMQHIVTGRFAVMAYVTLYNLDGNKCPWIKGESYTARIHYGSMTPGQKMQLMGNYDHNELVEILFESFKKLDTGYLSFFLHKDVDFRSPALHDPIISKAEYLYRTEIINENNRRNKEGPVKPELLKDSDGQAYIRLVYPMGNIDHVNVETSHGLITSIHITNVDNISQT